MLPSRITRCRRGVADCRVTDRVTTLVRVVRAVRTRTLRVVLRTSCWVSVDARALRAAGRAAGRAGRREAGITPGRAPGGRIAIPYGRIAARRIGEREARW